jgi:hypothetical protein
MVDGVASCACRIFGRLTIRVRPLSVSGAATTVGKLTRLESAFIVPVPLALYQFRLRHRWSGHDRQHRTFDPFVDKSRLLIDPEVHFSKSICSG